MHGSFFRRSRQCIYVIRACIVTVLNIKYKFINYLKGRLNLNERLSVWAFFYWKHRHSRDLLHVVIETIFQGIQNTTQAFQNKFQIDF